MTQVPPQAPKNAGPSTTWLTGLVLVMYVIALGLSVYLAMHGRYELGVGGALACFVLAPIAFAIVMGSMKQNARLLARVDELSRCVRSIGDYASLSEDARRVLNRSNDREILLSAIQEDIDRRDWDAAMILVKELAERFGYRSEAEVFRKKITSARAQTTDTEITEAIGYLDGLIIQRRWDEAYADAARLLRLFPDSTRVFGLRGRVEMAQRSYKEDLERRFLLATQEDNTEEAMKLLKELDFYLTAAEAEPLREMARGVIGKARENLGAQFKLAVKDRNWRQAASLGERIIADFPNSRMAAEVRDVIDGIRMKLNSTAA